jgi:gliding motility-associated-like protein
MKKMKNNALTITCMVVALFSIFTTSVVAQITTTFQSENNSAGPVQESIQNNFTSFSNKYKAPDNKWLANNKGYANHPDAGFINDEPVPNAIEILSKRTRDSRYFIDRDTASKFYIIQAYGDINYQKDGQWLSIDKCLQPVSKNILEASHQQEPVGFDLQKKISYIKTIDGTFYFNNWQLSGQDQNGEKILAKADWSNISTGDDGIKINNIFPGIDAEMIVNRGSVKTNFIVKQNKFKGYRQLIFTDEFNVAGSGSGAMRFSADQHMVQEQGDIDFCINKKAIAHISKVVMFSQKEVARSYKYLTCQVNQDQLSIVVNENDLDQQLINGNIIIDPVVSTTSSLSTASITGSMNNGSLTDACVYPLQVATPAQAYFTNIAVNFSTISYSPAVTSQAFFYVTGTNCNKVSNYYDSKDPSYNSPGISVTKGDNGSPGFASVPQLLNCLPPPSCAVQHVTFYLGFYNTVTNGPDNVCSNTYVEAYAPFQLEVTGRTVEIDPVNNGITADPAVVCRGGSTTLTGHAIYGVAPYTYTWSTGATGNSTIVTPALVSTPYSVIAKDNCGNIANGAINVTVQDPVAPSVTITTPATTVCQGYNTTFTAHSTTGGDAPLYQWFVNGNPVAGVTSGTYTTTTLATGDQVYCILTSNYFCVSPNTATSDTLTIAVTPSIVPTNIVTSSDNNFCFGKRVTFAAHTTNVGSSPSYHWQVNGIDAGVTDSVFTSSSLVNNDQVTCVVDVSNTGCYTMQTITSNVIIMTVYPLPVITFSPDTIILARYDSVKINTIVVGDFGSPVWIPAATLVNPESITPIADPVSNTTYQLSVISSHDCVGTGDITIQVYDKIFIPNAFAPNGKNKIFRIPPGIVFNLENFSIYDRWGTKVFATTDITKGWDGTNGAYNSPPGVYVYIISGSDARSKVLVKGTVTLIR